jgi:hypothetical protein
VVENDRITIVRDPALAAGFSNGTGAAARFNAPEGMAIDPDGNLYVTDTGNQRIRKITPGRVVTTYSGLETPGYTDGVKTAARFDGPAALAIDADGTLHVIDRENGRIREVAPNGSVATSLAGDLSAYIGLRGIAVSGAGVDRVVYFSANHGIYAIDSVGTVTLFAGDPASGFVDGTGTAARFDSPGGLTFDIDGNLYVADTGNHRIRRIAPDGEVITFAGSGVMDTVDGPGTPPTTETIAAFDSPVSIAMAGPGEWLVGQIGDSLIRRLSSTTGRAQAASDLVGNEKIEVSLLISGLSRGIYYFRAIATNFGGTTVTSPAAPLGTTVEPEITVDQPSGVDIVDGGSIEFAPVAVGLTLSRTFTVRNTGPALLNITGINVTGANPGDFVLTDGFPAPLVMAPGESVSFPVTFAPAARGSRTAVLSIISDDADENPFDVTLQGLGLDQTRFPTWALTVFDVDDANDPLIGGPNADPSQDGVSNLMNYALGLEPTTYSRNGLPKPELKDGLLTLTYNRSVAATDLNFIVEWSDGLGSWSTVGLTVAPTGATTATTREFVASIPVAGSEAKFIRLRVVRR